MQSPAATVDEYLDSLPAERRAALQAVRQVILANLDPGFAEGMQYGMIGYYVPHVLYPPGYHCDPRQPLCYAGLASQKQYMALYLMCVYGDEGERAWFQQAWATSGKKLDMGKSCIRFRRLEDLPLDVIGEAFRRVPARAYIAQVEAALQRPREGRPRAASKTSHGKGAKRAPAKKAAPKR